MPLAMKKSIVGALISLALLLTLSSLITLFYLISNTSKDLEVIINNVVISTKMPSYPNEGEGCKWWEIVAPPSSCKTIDGKECIFPSKIDGKTYKECVHDDIGDWCSTLNDENGHYLEGHWGICGDNCKKNDGVCRTTEGEECIFPTIVDGKIFHSCLYTHISGWCSTRNYEDGTHVHGWWGVCQDNYCPICRTTNGEKCIFPSIINGTWYRDYIHDPEIGNWCSTLNDEFENNVDGHWGICGDHCPPMLGNEVNSDLECKTVDGEDCIFPSIIDGITFHKCVPDPYEGDWCSTLNDENGHHIDGYFGNCEESCKNLNSDDGCQIIEWVGDEVCDDENNIEECAWDGGDCCNPDADLDYCTDCLCLDPNFDLSVLIG